MLGFAETMFYCGGAAGKFHFPNGGKLVGGSFMMPPIVRDCRPMMFQARAVTGAALLCC